MILPRYPCFFAWCLLLSAANALNLRSGTGLTSGTFRTPIAPNSQSSLSLSHECGSLPFLQELVAMDSLPDPPANRAYMSVTKSAHSVTASLGFGIALFISTICSIGAAPSIVYGYGESQYLSDAVKVAVQAVDEASVSKGTSKDDLVRAYENIAEIITEGKGVGGAINFQGVQLDRGFVSDEDTTIYNPGLTLLTETEKDRLVEAIVKSKKQRLSDDNSAESWSDDLQAGYTFLRDRLDPLHMYELRGYLSILPWYGAFMYLVALGIQQLAREVFPIAYIACAAAVFLPIAVLVVLGP